MQSPGVPWGVESIANVRPSRSEVGKYEEYHRRTGVVRPGSEHLSCNAEGARLCSQSCSQFTCFAAGRDAGGGRRGRRGASATTANRTPTTVTMPMNLNEMCDMSTMPRLPDKRSDSPVPSTTYYPRLPPGAPPSRGSNGVSPREIRTPCSPRVTSATTTPPSTVPAMLARSLAAPRLESEPMPNPGFPGLCTRRTQPGAAFRLSRTRDLIPNHPSFIRQAPHRRRASLEGARLSPRAHPARPGAACTC